LHRKPILPGNDANHQLELIFNLIGTPTDEDIQCIPTTKARDKVMRMARRPARAFETIFRTANPNAMDLLKKMLVFNPARRITIEEALSHPYLVALHYPEDEPVREPVSLFDFEFERQLLTMRDTKDLIYNEILLYHFQDKRDEYERAKIEYARQLHIPGRMIISRDADSDEDLEIS